ncbi:SatD family protein [Butyrivibrio sp. AE2015]|uniref:SatD family protein n=1 Tax=Butyrivibrio sp. AE2015 TaxID=1280663 RepID=UPI0003B6C3DD|nr:SatD family protein [Butyrivibrio sp. AE2015]
MGYVAVIGDIKDSKKVHNRGLVQNELKRVLAYINSKYIEDVAANFVITLGDEFQGLLITGNNLFEIIRLIKRSMYPVEIRFGIGVGKITTSIDPQAAIGADGPAFYAAREMIEELRRQEKKLKDQAPDVKLAIYGKPDDIQVEQINTFLRMTKMIEKSWSSEQRETIVDTITNGGSQAERAKRLKTTQSTIARRLKSANYDAYRDIENITDRAFTKVKV